MCKFSLKTNHCDRRIHNDFKLKFKANFALKFCTPSLYRLLDPQCQEHFDAENNEQLLIPKHLFPYLILNPCLAFEIKFSLCPISLFESTSCLACSDSTLAMVLHAE